MLSILISIFGFVLVKLVLSRFENCQLIHVKKSKTLFFIFTFPLYFSVVFKEHFLLFVFYIGIFVSTLIVFFLFYEKYAFFVFSSRKISYLKSVIFLISVGNSPQKAFFESFEYLNSFEKYVFRSTLLIFHQNNQKIESEFVFVGEYVNQLSLIFNSKSKILPQLHSYYRSLQMIQKFRQRSNAVTLQLRAQAVVSLLIYIVIFSISWNFFNLKAFPGLIALSFIMFLSGLGAVFCIGRKIKWSI